MFSATGFNIVGGVPQPKAIVEVIVFHGDGTLEVPAATVSLNGVIIRSLPSFGTYTVEDTCVGTITLNGPTFDMFLSPDGDDISMIQTNPNTVFQGLATRSIENGFAPSTKSRGQDESYETHIGDRVGGGFGFAWNGFDRFRSGQ